MATYQFVMKFRGPGFEARNIHYYEDPVLIDANAPQIAQGLADAWGQHLRGFTLGAVELYGVDYRNVSVAGMPTLDAGIEAPGGGLATGEQTGAGQTALLISWRAIAPPPNRARSYIVGIHAKHLNIATGWDNGLRAAANAYAAAITVITVGLAEYPVPKQAARYNPATRTVDDANDVTSWAVRPFPGTQRRRRYGVGA